MALTELLAGLEEEAADETARLEAETRDEAHRIVEAARAEARAVAEQAGRADERELRRETHERRARARLAAAAVRREAREQVFGELLEDVRVRLVGLRTGSAYPDVLRELIRESLSVLPAATTLRVDPRDESLAAELVAGLDARLQLVPVLETAGGVEAAGADGRTVRNTVEERLANAQPALRVLFGDTLSERGRVPDPDRVTTP
jgi:V/A-type H+-transporting ATPase subunit E